MNKFCNGWNKQIKFATKLKCLENLKISNELNRKTVF